VRKLIAVLLAAGSLLAGSACGGGGDGSDAVAPEEYASSVCSAIGAWQDSLIAASSVLQERLNTEDDLEVVRAQFVTFYGGAIEETDKMLAAVEAVGVPDVEQGEAAAATMLTELRSFRPLLADALAKARKLPVANEFRFTTQAQTLGAGYRFEVSKLATLFDVVGEQHDAPELVLAAADIPTCTDL
jgi:hypothetical protein